MRTNTDCTLFCRSVQGPQRTTRWGRSVLRGVCWQSGGAVSDRKRPQAGNIDIFIPLGVQCPESFVSPAAYQREPLGHWTLREGDLLVRGVVPAADIGTLLALDDAAVIVSAALNDFGAPEMRHWEVCAR